MATREAEERGRRNKTGDKKCCRQGGTKRKSRRSMMSSLARASLEFGERPENGLIQINVS